MQRRVAARVEELAAVAAGDGAEGDRRVVRAEYRGAGVGDGLPQAAGRDRHAVDVAELALVGAEAQTRVALDVLDGLEALAGGELDAGGGDVVLLVHELLGRAHRGLHVRHLVERGRPALAQLAHRGQLHRGRLQAAGAQGMAGRLDAVGKGFRERHAAVYAAGRGHALHLTGHEAEDVAAPLGARAGVGGQMDHWAVAAGARHGIAGEFLDLAAHAEAGDVDCRDQRAGHALVAARLDHGAAGEDADTPCAGLVDQVPFGLVAGVGDRDHLAAGLDPVQRRAIGMIVGRRQHQAPAGRHRIAADIGGDGARHHVARHVVVGVHQRALVGPRGEDHLPGTHLVHACAHAAPALERRRGGAEVLGAALMQGDEVVVVVAVGGGAGQQQHVGQTGELGDDALHQIRGRAAVDHLAGVEQRAAHFLLLVAQDHARPGAAGGQRGGETRRAGTDHQHVALAIDVVVDVRVALPGRPAEARRLADVLLVLWPQGGRRHEGLVVEARRHEAAAHLADHAHHVAVHAGPAVGARRHQIAVQRLLGRAHVGHLLGVGLAHLEDGVRLLGAGSHDAARARVLEAAVDHVHAVGE